MRLLPRYQKTAKMAVFLFFCSGSWPLSFFSCPFFLGACRRGVCLGAAPRGTKAHFQAARFRPWRSPSCIPPLPTTTPHPRRWVEGGRPGAVVKYRFGCGEKVLAREKVMPTTTMEFMEFVGVQPSSIFSRTLDKYGAELPLAEVEGVDERHAGVDERHAKC